MKKLERKTNLFNRSLTRRQLAIVLSACLGPTVLISSYGFGFEARNLKIEALKLSITGFPGKLRIVHLTDLHFTVSSRYMEYVLKRVNDLKPDHVYITGDLVDKKDYLAGCLDWIGKINCGNIYFSPGNWEHWAGTLTMGLAGRLADIGVQTLNNAGQIIERSHGAFFLSGLDDVYYGSPNVAKAFNENRHHLPAILLSHSPLGVNTARPKRPDLILSGHTHGGQIRIPGIGAIKTPPGSGQYEQGLYLTDQTQLYVNRGIGTSLIPIRIFCPPEIALIEISA